MSNLQNGNAVVAELGNLLVPARCAVGRRVAPRVVVEGEEVAVGGRRTAVHVGSGLEAVGLDISGRVSDGNLTELARVHVGLDVTGNSLDVRGGVGGVVVVDDLVSREEQQGVVVLGEHLDGREDALEVDLVVRLLGRSAVEGVLGGVQVERKVNAGVGQEAHAGVVVRGVVDGVDTDSVDSKLLELGNVALAASGVSDWVLCVGGATGLVVDTTNVKAIVASKESCGD